MKKVLIVDDEPDFQELLKVTLEFGDYQVILAGTGQEALKLAQAQCPNVIVLDVVLPHDEIDGLEVCRRLKSNPATAGCTIILLSGKVSQRDIEAGWAAGADDYVTKPFSPLSLIGKIEKSAQESFHRNSASSRSKSTPSPSINLPLTPINRPHTPLRH